MIGLETLSAIAAFVAAGGAVAAAVVSGWSFRKSRLSEVIAYLDHCVDGDGYVFVVENIGEGVAYDIHVEAGPMPIEQEQRLALNSIGSDIPMLPPGSSRRTVVWTRGGRMEASGMYKAVVRYAHKPSGKLSVAEYPIEYATLQNEPRNRSELQALRRTLERCSGGN